MRPQFFLNKSEPSQAPASGSSSSGEPARKRKNWFGTFLLVVLFLSLAGGLGYVGKLYLDAKNQLKVVSSDVANKAVALSDQELSVLINTVGKHITLPTDRPQVVTITNVDQLKVNQPFFLSAQNGDKLLVYTKKVILYRPSLDKIIDIAQINAATESATTVPTARPTASPTPTAPPASTPVIATPSPSL